MKNMTTLGGSSRLFQWNVEKADSARRQIGIACFMNPLCYKTEPGTALPPQIVREPKVNSVTPNAPKGVLHPGVQARHERPPALCSFVRFSPPAVRTNRESKVTGDRVFPSKAYAQSPVAAVQ